MKIDNKFDIGQKVFLVTDKEQLERIVTGICISSLGLTYRVARATDETWHYDFELSDEKDLVKSLT